MRRELMRIFKSADSKGIPDGKLNQAELLHRLNLADLRKCIPDFDRMVDGDGNGQVSMNEVYYFLDKNEDGSVSMAEFVEAFTKPLEAAEGGKMNLKRNQDSNVAMLFEMMDADKGGTVSKFEFIEFLREHKPKEGRWNNVARLQESFGLNNKSEIGMDDFQAGFKKCIGLKITDFEIYSSMA